MTFLHKKSTFGSVLAVLLCLTLLFVISFPFLKDLLSEEVHIDEDYWIISAKFFTLLFQEKETRNLKWHSIPAYDQPPIGKYIFGSALSIAGNIDTLDDYINCRMLTVDSPIFDIYRSASMVADTRVASKGTPPRIEGRIVTKDQATKYINSKAQATQNILYVARVTAVLFGIGSCLLVFWIGWIVFNIRAGVVSALLLAYNPLMLVCGRRALTDTMLVFFVLASILVMIHLYSSILRQKIIRVFGLTAALGLAIALSAGTKLNGCLVVVIFTLFCIAFTLVKIKFYSTRNLEPPAILQNLDNDLTIKLAFISLCVAGLVALSIFIFTNPSLYYEPREGMLVMLKSRINTVIYQQREFGSSAIRSIGEKIYFVVSRTLFPKHFAMFGRITKLPIDFILFIVGLFMLCRDELCNIFKNQTLSNNCIIILWVFVMFIGTIIWIPLDWERYYLPVVPCIAIVSGYSISKIIDFCLKRI
ncbi:ArnT family glycosyltransferase [Thermoproteota archaeon]